MTWKKEWINDSVGIPIELVHRIMQNIVIVVGKSRICHHCVWHRDVGYSGIRILQFDRKQNRKWPSKKLLFRPSCVSRRWLVSLRCTLCFHCKHKTVIEHGNGQQQQQTIKKCTSKGEMETELISRKPHDGLLMLMLIPYARGIRSFSSTPRCGESTRQHNQWIEISVSKT